jgi:hypothetical protein
MTANDTNSADAPSTPRRTFLRRALGSAIGAVGVGAYGAGLAKSLSADEYVFPKYSAPEAQRLALIALVEQAQASATAGETWTPEETLKKYDTLFQERLDEKEVTHVSKEEQGDRFRKVVLTSAAVGAIGGAIGEDLADKLSTNAAQSMQR